MVASPREEDMSDPCQRVALITSLLSGIGLAVTKSLAT
jgi:hypothetical protein